MRYLLDGAKKVEYEIRVSKWGVLFINNNSNDNTIIKCIYINERHVSNNNVDSKIEAL